ncbi:hypothetical protein [Komagataeibacter sp. FNDCF1]|uniref:hypothetical protein n=1 Tax=Komagataeibacter sp. FNDCF1 TaxID=2878681 RepID=UPI001E30780C|nr:hypothetical protein [Komagataeibacter sp. FNDCF1]MCE2563155.1 hypothetical protein [Komagataeibacter sp. FNDCF1]
MASNLLVAGFVPQRDRPACSGRAGLPQAFGIVQSDRDGTHLDCHCGIPGALTGRRHTQA